MGRTYARPLAWDVSARLGTAGFAWRRQRRWVCLIAPSRHQQIEDVGLFSKPGSRFARWRIWLLRGRWRAWFAGHRSAESSQDHGHIPAPSLRREAETNRWPARGSALPSCAPRSTLCWRRIAGSSRPTRGHLTICPKLHAKRKGLGNQDLAQTEVCGRVVALTPNLAISVAKPSFRTRLNGKPFVHGSYRALLSKR